MGSDAGRWIRRNQVIGVADVNVDVVRRVAAHKQYRDDAALVALKVLDAAGHLKDMSSGVTEHLLVVRCGSEWRPGETPPFTRVKAEVRQRRSAGAVR